MGVKNNRTLRRSLQSLGDTQEALAAREVHERSGRQKLRNLTRQRLQKCDQERTLMEHQIASRDEEWAVWRERLQAAVDLERHTRDETRLAQSEVESLKSYTVAHRIADYRRQLHELVAVDECLREELSSAQQ